MTTVPATVEGYLYLRSTPTVTDGTGGKHKTLDEVSFRSESSGESDPGQCEPLLQFETLREHTVVVFETRGPLRVHVMA